MDESGWLVHTQRYGMTAFMSTKSRSFGLQYNLETRRFKPLRTTQKLKFYCLCLSPSVPRRTYRSRCANVQSDIAETLSLNVIQEAFCDEYPVLNTLRSAHIYWHLRQIRSESLISTTVRTQVLLVSVLELAIVLLIAAVIFRENISRLDTVQITVGSSSFTDWLTHVLVRINCLRTNHEGTVSELRNPEWLSQMRERNQQPMERKTNRKYSVLSYHRSDWQGQTGKRVFTVTAANGQVPLYKREPRLVSQLLPARPATNGLVPEEQVVSLATPAGWGRLMFSGPLLASCNMSPRPYMAGPKWTRAGVARSPSLPPLQPPTHAWRKKGGGEIFARVYARVDARASLRRLRRPVVTPRSHTRPCVPISFNFISQGRPSLHPRTRQPSLSPGFLFLSWTHNCPSHPSVVRQLKANHNNPSSVNPSVANVQYANFTSQSSFPISTFASHQAEPGSIPGRFTGLSQVGIVPDDAVGRRVFSGIPASSAPSFLRRSIFTSITLIGSQDLGVKSRPNLFTHSAYTMVYLTHRNPHTLATKMASLANNMPQRRSPISAWPSHNHSENEHTLMKETALQFRPYVFINFVTQVSMAKDLPRGVQFPGGSLRIFASGNRAGRCRWSAGFLGDFPFSPPFNSSTVPYSPHFTLIASQDLDVKSQPNSLSLLTHRVAGVIMVSNFFNKCCDFPPCRGVTLVAYLSGATLVKHVLRLDPFSLIRVVDFHCESDVFHWGSGGAVARTLASHHDDPGLIPGGFPPGFSHVGIVLDDATGRWIFSRYSRFRRPCIPASLHPRVSSLSCHVRGLRAPTGPSGKPCHSASVASPWVHSPLEIFFSTVSNSECSIAGHQLVVAPIIMNMGCRAACARSLPAHPCARVVRDSKHPVPEVQGVCLRAEARDYDENRNPGLRAHTQPLACDQLPSPPPAAASELLRRIGDVYGSCAKVHARRPSRGGSEWNWRYDQPRGKIAALRNIKITIDGLISGVVAPVFSHVGIVPGDASGRRVFSGISRFPSPFRSGAAPYSLHFTLINSQELDVKSRSNIFTHFTVSQLNAGLHTVIISVACGKVLQGKLVLAQCCTQSAHATGHSNQSETEKSNVLRPLTRERRGTHYTRTVTVRNVKYASVGVNAEHRSLSEEWRSARPTNRLKFCQGSVPGIKPRFPRNLCRSIADTDCFFFWHVLENGVRYRLRSRKFDRFCSIVITSAFSEWRHTSSIAIFVRLTSSLDLDVRKCVPVLVLAYLHTSSIHCIIRSGTAAVQCPRRPAICGFKLRCSGHKIPCFQLLWFCCESRLHDVPNVCGYAVCGSKLRVSALPMVLTSVIIFYERYSDCVSLGQFPRGSARELAAALSACFSRQEQSCLHNWGGSLASVIATVVYSPSEATADKCPIRLFPVTVPSGDEVASLLALRRYFTQQTVLHNRHDLA
ncbi:hypothetical protein PR048_000727 [Dryococelus australis]|uniref:Uncharacterized protein n=1 Tax=Dryococelus australis TaxID=614101 RepID=A0ABQ9IFF5_9NEOP|nr:hypothetical protein PR048_000727 [Dryococelus australis]